MYFAMVVLLMGVFPVVSIAVEHALGHGDAPFFLIGKWFVFWAVGARLALAGVRQALNPKFTAEKIFGIKDPAALIVVRELGFGNLSIGALGLLSVFHASWVVPAAIVGALFFGLAGIEHLDKSERNATENVAMVSDLFISVVLAADLVALLVGRA